MSILTPSGLETIDYGQQGWNAILTSNFQKMNDDLIWLDASGQFILPVPPSAAPDIDIANGYMHIWQDEVANKLKFKVRQSGGTFKNFELPGGVAYDTFVLRGGRNRATAQNEWLRGEGNTLQNISPFVLPYAAEILAISIASGAAASWTAEVYKNADIVTPPTPANRIAFLTATAEQYKREVLATPVSLADQDRIAIYLQGGPINRPTVSLYIQGV